MCTVCEVGLSIPALLPLWYIAVIRMVRAIKARPAPGRFPPFPPQVASVQPCECVDSDSWVCFRGQNIVGMDLCPCVCHESEEINESWD